jgi:hypothetical protein
MIKNNSKDVLTLIFYVFLAFLLIFFSTYIAFTYPSTKPPPRFKNTLQRDINP